MKHTRPKEIGKARLVKQPKGEITRDMVEGWFTRFPNANIGILIKESGLVIVDADSIEAVEEFEKIWADSSMIPTVTTGRGKHYYFRAKASTPPYRSIHRGKSGMIDIFSNGYIVAPPSIHANGHRYMWSNPPKKIGLPFVPGWIENFLSAEVNKKTAENEQLNSIKVEVTAETKITLSQFPLNHVIKSIIVLAETSPYYQERGYISKSEALHGMIIACYQRGLNDNQVFSIFSNERYRLSYKYIENKRSAEWLKGEMKRAKEKIALRSKKNSRSPKTAISRKTPNENNFSRNIERTY